MPVLPSGIVQIDTLLGGIPGAAASYLVEGDAPAVVDTGAQTSAEVLAAALAARGLGPEDLAWIILTHVHLDHCGGTGDLARAFPRARIVVHPRGARHLVAPDRLVEATRAVFGGLDLLGGLEAVEEARIVPADDGVRIAIGPGRDLVALHAPGHARHHLVVLDEATGVVMAGDALGVRLPGARLYPAVPPPEFDLDAARATLARLRALDPAALLLGHFGDVGDPAAALTESERLQTLAAGAAARAWRRFGTVAAVDRAVRAIVPPEPHLGGALATMRRLGWVGNNAVGLARWAQAQAEGAL
ncbi:MAG: MBL fold metallo-hydrolase [Actinomycetota bacterium]